MATDFIFSLIVNRMVNINPNAAINSENHNEGPLLIFDEYCIKSISNIKWAINIPSSPPSTCATMYKMNILKPISLLIRNTSDTAGLKWAPEIAPNIVINT